MYCCLSGPFFPRPAQHGTAQAHTFRPATGGLARGVQVACHAVTHHAARAPPRPQPARTLLLCVCFLTQYRSCCRSSLCCRWRVLLHGQRTGRAQLSLLKSSDPQLRPSVGPTADMATARCLVLLAIACFIAPSSRIELQRGVQQLHETLRQLHHQRILLHRMLSGGRGLLSAVQAHTNYSRRNRRYSDSCDCVSRQCLCRCRVRQANEHADVRLTQLFHHHLFPVLNVVFAGTRRSGRSTRQ